jgi:outer membrane receptor protein involved in Fe transport
MVRFALAALLAAFSPLAFSQSLTSGDILGTVSDSSGAVVADAKVTVRNLETNISKDTVTNGEGRFRVPLLPAGSYEVAVEKTGFAKYLQRPVTLQLGRTADLTVTLNISSTSEVVQVTADATIINTTNAEISTNFDSKRISELPLAPNGNVLNLALSVPGVSQLSEGNSTFASGGVSFSVNGNRTRSNNFMIDGGDSNDPSVGGLVQQVNNPDSVAEFKIITNQFLAEYGRSSGSVVNIITKSGTNEFHGTAFWRYNGNKLNSRSNLDERVFPEAPWRVENQFAGTVGGPIVKNKTFFFASLMRWTDRQFASGANITGAPTAAGQATLRQLENGRPWITTLLANLPAAQAANGPTVPVTAGGQTFQVQTGTLSGAQPGLTNDWQALGRIDHQFNERHQINGRYNIDDRLTVSGQSVPPGLTSNNPARRQGIATTFTSSFTPTVLNELRASFQRFNSVTAASDPRAETLPSIEITQLGLTGFNSANDRTAIGLALNLPQASVFNNYQLSDNFSWLKGSHSMKFGFDFRRQDQYSLFNPTLRGRLTYVSLQDFVDDIAQVQQINSPLQGVPLWQSYRYYDYFFYVQDEWKVTSNLTLTYGLRYETPGNAYGYLQDINDRVVAANNNNPAFRVDPLPQRDTNNWAPRFGFNYRFGKAPGMLNYLTGDGKLVVRGGYARSYDLIFNNLTLNVFSSFPFTVITAPNARTPGGFGLIDGIRRGTIQPTVNNPLQIPRTISATDFRSPVSEQFSFQMQRELAQNWGFTVGYVGTKGTALFQTLDGNPVVSAPGATIVRQDPNRGVIRLRANSASSIYHSLQSSLEKRLSQNFTMAAHYTWSSFIDDASETFNSSVRGEVAVPQDSFNRAADRGRSTYDRPHRFSVNAVYEVPFFREQRGLIGRLLGGWQINGFLTLQSGAPFSALDGGDPGLRLSGIDGLVGNSIRANVVTDLNVASMSVEDIWGYRVANPPANASTNSLFSRVSVANPFGNAGRNILRADGIGNLDLGFFKNIRTIEGQNLQFRSEFFNSTNTRNFGIPEARVNNAGFANQWNTSGGNRRIVLGLRYQF